MLRIAYFVNEYPKVSHTFIRREILALEQQGVPVYRFALRGWEGTVTESADLRERDITRFILKRGFLYLALRVVPVLTFSPMRFLAGLGLALRMAKRSARPFAYHLGYLLEACCLLIWMRRFGATHLHAHFGTNSAEIAMLAHALGGPPYSFTVHGPEEFDKPEALRLREKVSRAAFVVVISSFGRAQLMRWTAHADWGKIKVVRCGVDQAFHDVPPSPVPSASRLVCVGRLCEQKGQLLLIEAVARLAERGLDCEVILAGDGEMRTAIEAAIARNKLESSVRITGWIDSAGVRDEILAARALVLPSFAEGLPVVIMEALALRRPVVTTYVAGIPELVRHGENGWLVPAGDVEALADTIAEILTKSSEELLAMGETGRAMVLQQHDVDAEARKLVQCFKEQAGKCL
jgi:glycosyltransferase involved in cell wall biosynthesis